MRYFLIAGYEDTDLSVTGHKFAEARLDNAQEDAIISTNDPEWTPSSYEQEYNAVDMRDYLAANSDNWNG